MASMAPTATTSTLDLLVLTFNCAKKLIDVGVFAAHLQTAFRQNATRLPDLVVFSLQEIAPLSQAFIGDYFLGPYVARFDEAVNAAAAAATASKDGAHDEDDDDDDDEDEEEEGDAKDRRRYALVRAHNVGYTAMLLFARDPARVTGLQEAEVGFGAAEMGNKGAVGLRALYAVGGDGARSTEVTFVAAHLAAMEWNVPRRNANWAAIMRGLTFENPEAVLAAMGEGEDEGEAGADDGGDDDDDDDDDDDAEHRLLRDGHDLRLQRRLHDMSVFKPSSHLFVAGDLNYRTAATTPRDDSVFPSLDPQSALYYPAFLPLDQLTRERAAGRTLHGLTEHAVRFPPTYKYVAGGGDATNSPAAWRFAPHRHPSWTDRVLFLELPAWAGPRRMQVRAYDALPVMRTSDHRAVFLRVDVPLVPPAQLAPPPSPLLLGRRAAAAAATDPRVRLPVEIDPEAWERRKAARRKERLVGWAMFLWSTREGACVLAALLVAGLGGYWLYMAVYQGGAY